MKVMSAISRYFDKYTMLTGEEPNFIRLCEEHVKEYHEEDEELRASLGLRMKGTFKGKKIIVKDLVNGEKWCVVCKEYSLEEREDIT